MVSTVFLEPSSDPAVPIPESNPLANSSKAASVVGVEASRIQKRAAVGRPAPYIAMSPSTPIVSSCRWNVSATNPVCAFSILTRPPTCSGKRDGPVASYPRRHDADRDEREQGDADDAADPAAAPRRIVERARGRRPPGRCRRYPRCPGARAGRRAREPRRRLVGAEGLVALPAERGG